MKIFPQISFFYTESVMIFQDYPYVLAVQRQVKRKGSSLVYFAFYGYNGVV